MKKQSGAALIMALLFGSLIWGCSVREFRSPIVFRSPVVLDEPEPDESAEITKSSSQVEEANDNKQVTPLHAQPASSQPGTELRSDQDPIRYDREKNTKEALEGTILSETSIDEGERATEEVRLARQTDNIPVFSNNDLLHLNFKMLGRVSIRCHRANKCFSRDEAVYALKIEAVKKYGNMAMGLVNVQLEVKPKIFYYTKGRKNISTPKESDTYHKGSAGVVIWNK